MITKECLHCRKPFETRRNATRYCSEQCYQKARTGKSLAEYDRSANRRWYYPQWDGEPLHRAVMEQKLGRKLRPGEVVHHRDGDTTNFAPENLELRSSQADHRKAHEKIFRSETHKECTRCHVIKPSAAFTFNPNWPETWDRRSGPCKACESARGKESAGRRAATWQRKYSEEELAAMTLVCNRCGVEKPTSAFYRRNGVFRQIPYFRTCKECARAAYAERHGGRKP